MTSVALRPAWWIVFWGLLATLSIKVVLPAFDHHATEYNPYHGHLALGVTGAAQLQQALAAHAHGGVHGHPHGADTGPVTRTEPAWTKPTVTVIGLSGLDALRALLAHAPDLVVTAQVPLPQPPLAICLMVAAPALLLLKRLLPLPEHPPR